MTKLINIDSLPETFKVSELIHSSGGKLTRRMINYSVSSLLKEKKLLRLKNGMYSKTGDIFQIAYRLYGGYVGFSSALYLHGLKEEIEAVVYVCIAHNGKKSRVLDKIIEPVNMSENEYGTQIINSNGKEILVSTYPKTIFDMLAKPKYASYFDMYKAMKIRRLTENEWKELLYYAKNSNTTDIRRIGYALEGIAPARFTKELASLSTKGYRTSFFFKHEGKNYNSKWNIFDSLGVRRWVNAI